MKVLGISPFHDSSACLIENGTLKSFYKEERLSKVKRDNHPFLSIDKICSENEIDAAVISSPSNGDRSLYAYYSLLKKKYGIKEVIDFSDEHHLQHASLAFYNSGFDNALIFVIDRNGSLVNNLCRESESVFYASYPNNFKIIYKNFWLDDMNYRDQSLFDISNRYKNLDYTFEAACNTTHGIVKVYESATSLIMQDPLENGKVMGLSAYGEYQPKFDGLFIKENFGNYNILSTKNNYESINLSLNHLSEKNITSENYKIYADYAYAVQNQTQYAALQLIKKYVEKTGIKNVCVTGGYALNVVANALYLKLLPEVNFYFEPLADDSGNSVGGALFYYREKTKDNKINKIKDTFYHGEYTNNIQLDIDYSMVIEKILQQKTVALFYGKAEAGPRALGHRSILFDARNPKAKQIVNVVKKREWYRPFAGIMLKEDAEKFFEVDASNLNYRFMTVNAYAKDIAKEQLSGILHVDNTCRIQIIDDENEPVFNLLRKFKDITGIGVLLNTSFNLAGYPLVETIEDATETLNNSKLDYLWIPQKNTIIS